MHVLCTRLCVPKFQSCRVHAVCVCDQAEYFYGHIDEQLKQSNLLDSEGKQLRAVDIVDIIDGYNRKRLLSVYKEATWYDMS